MMLISPKDTPQEIINLINEAKTEFIAVTAFINVADWTELIEAVDAAVERGVNIFLYYRESNNRNDLHYLKSAGVVLFHIPQLHAKFYINDSAAIISSMNLLEHSSKYAIEIALKLTNQEELKDLKDYFEKEIESLVNHPFKKSQSSTYNYTHNLKSKLSRSFPDSTFKAADGYVFSSNLIPYFHIMIKEDGIHFKYPRRDWDENKKQELERLPFLQEKGSIKIQDESDNLIRWQVSNIPDIIEFLSLAKTSQ
jgi:hypothetical protein